MGNYWRFLDCKELEVLKITILRGKLCQKGQPPSKEFWESL